MNSKLDLSSFDSEDDLSYIKYSKPFTHGFVVDNENDVHQHKFVPLFPLSTNEMIKMKNDLGEKGNSRPFFKNISGGSCMVRVEIPDSVNMSLDGVSIRFCDPSLILPRKSFHKRYIHSWIDLNEMNNSEANRSLVLYYQGQYIKLTNDKDTLKVDFPVALPKASSVIYTSCPHRIFHYVGVGFPRIRDDSICFRNAGFLNEDWVSIRDLRLVLQSKSFFIFDCDNSAVLMQHLLNPIYHVENPDFAFFSCSKGEIMHIPEDLPQNLFTCILLSPIASLSSISPEYEILKKNEKVATTLLNVFTESIALDSLDREKYYFLFRGHSVISSLWRNFILAQRLMKLYGITVQSIPDIPDLTHHPLWDVFEYSLCFCLTDSVSSFSHIYSDHFLKVSSPSSQIISVICSLLKTEELYEPMLEVISVFMMKSPSNCSLMASYLDINYLSKRFINPNRSAEGSYCWFKIVFGFLFVSPKCSKTIAAVLDARTILQTILSHQTQEESRPYIIAVVLCLCDAQTHFQGFFGSMQTVKDIIPFICSSEVSLETRLWFILLLRSIVIRISLEFSSDFLLTLQYLSFLFLNEQCQISRATAVSILCSFMSKDNIDLNTYLLRLASKASIDGSSEVRLSYVVCVIRYLECGGEIHIGDKLIFSKILGDKEPNEPVADMLYGSIVYLSNDKNSEVRHFAKSILETPELYKSESSQVSQEIMQKLVTSHQYCASVSLLTEYCKPPVFQSRFPDYFLDGHDKYLLKDKYYEILDEIQCHKSRVSCVKLMMNNFDIISGSDDGSVYWMNKTWDLHSPIISISQIDPSFITCSSNDSSISVIKYNEHDPIDQFSPFSDRNRKTTIVSYKDCYDLHFNNGGTDVIQWDIQALLPISQFSTSNDIISWERKDNILIMGESDGIVSWYDTRSNMLISQSSYLKNERIIRTGYNNDLFYSATESGLVSIYDQFTAKSQYKHFGQFKDFLIHPKHQICTTVEENYTNLYSLNGFVTICKINTECCLAFDYNRPIAAAGHKNGSVTFRRIDVDNIKEADCAHPQPQRFLPFNQ